MKNMKKVFAFVLALAMILTTYQPTTTYAATKAPTISAKKMTLQVGSKKMLTVKNAGKNATLKWSSNKKTVATVSKKGVVKAVKAGTANVKCKVVTKSKKHYTLTCKVTVKNAAVSKTVSTQKALAAALKDKNVKNLTIKTDKEVAFNIPSGNYGKVKLTVDAPNADVVNAGTFKSINIKAIKPNTWKEKAKGNTITVTADDARIVVEAGASLSKVTVSQEGGKIKIEATGTIDAIQIDAAVDVSLAVDGTVGKVAVSAPAKVAVEGKTTTAIPVKVEETAKGADVTSSTPVEVKAATEISLNLSKGAEGSKVETTGENARVAVKNDTTDVIKVTTPAGTQEVAKDTTSKVDNTGKVTDTTTNTSGDNNGGSTGGGSTSGGGSSSGGSTSGGGSSSGGSTGGDVTPELPAGKLGELSVLSKNKISVYPSDIEEVPETLAKENVTVKNPQGETVGVAEIKRDADENGGYYITLASDLVDGEYTFTMILKGKKYTDTFVYDSAIRSKLDELERLIKEYENKPVISASALTTPKLCEKAMYDGITNKLGDKLNGFTLEVEYMGSPSVKGNELTASMWIAIYDDANGKCELYDEVTFVCTGDTFNAKAPSVIYRLSNSIVVKYESGYEYACTEKGTRYEDIPKNSWVSETDELGNCEITGLNAGKTYEVYGRVVIAPEYHESTEAATLSDTKQSTMCIASTAETTSLNKGTVKPGDIIKFTLKGLKVACYGQKENTKCAGDVLFACDDSGLNYQLNCCEWSMNESDPVTKEPILKFTVPQSFKERDYNIKINYYFVNYATDDNGEYKWDEVITKSDPLTYTIQFHCDGTNSVSAEKPHVVYKLKNSVVIKAKEGYVYACVEKGTSIDKVPENAWYYGADEYGNLEFDGLEADKDYIVYCYLKDTLCAYNSIETRTDSAANPAIICLAESAETSIDMGEVKAGEGVSVLLNDLKVGLYGAPKNTKRHGAFTITSENEGLATSISKAADMSELDQDTKNPLVKFTIPQELKKGEYTFQILYTFGCYGGEGDKEESIAVSKPLIYTVTFTVQ